MRIVFPVSFIVVLPRHVRATAQYRTPNGNQTRNLLSSFEGRLGQFRAQSRPSPKGANGRVCAPKQDFAGRPTPRAWRYESLLNSNFLRVARRSPLSRLRGEGWGEGPSIFGERRK